MALAGVLIVDPVTGIPIKDPTSGMPFTVPPDGDISCFCECAPGCGGACVNVVLDSVLIVVGGCRSFDFEGAGTFQLLPRNIDGTPSDILWSGCFNGAGPTVACGLPNPDGGGCDAGILESSDTLFIVAYCPNTLPPTFDGKWFVSLVAGDVGFGGLSEGCCTAGIIGVDLDAGVTLDLSTLSLDISGTITLNTTCTGTLPDDCVLCGTPVACEECINSGVTATCVDPLPATIGVDCSFFSLCAKDGCADTCTLGECVMTLTGTCAGGDATYTGYIDGGGGHCVKVVDQWNSTNQTWLMTVSDVRCGTETVMWAGFWVSGVGGPVGWYRQWCDHWCAIASNGQLCQVQVTSGGGSSCMNLEDFPIDPGDCSPDPQPATITFTVSGTIKTCDGTTGSLTTFTMSPAGASCAGGVGPSYSYIDANFIITYSYDSSVGQWEIGINDISGLAWAGILASHSVTGAITLICGQCCAVNCSVITITVT